MMNAEVTAENRPAFGPSQDNHIKTLGGTHEDQGRVQVIVVFLEKILVVPFGLLVIALIEPSLVILFGRDRVLRLWATRELFWSNSLFLVPFPFWRSFRNLPVIED